ncbi:MAG: YeeE/YedE family protein [Bdellovibrionales bacterium]|nr:YeeE/YedE family protein [Bdellovibrionales bacterium]
MALAGGMLIGLSVTIMLLALGRVTGVSGITYKLIIRDKGDWVWRGFFVVGLVLGGVTLRFFYADSLINSVDHGLGRIALAGLLVGFGTVLGNGCTSGHGVCGISRFSLRSITATLTFICFGIATVAIVDAFLGGVVY